MAGPEADLDVFGDAAQLYVLPANETLTFEHTYTWWGESSGEPRSSGRSHFACVAPRRLSPRLQPPAFRLLVTSTACPPANLLSRRAVRLSAQVVMPQQGTLPLLSVCLPPAGHSRRLRVTANPNITLSRAHVPWRCRWARVVLLGPLTLHDVDAASFAHNTGEQHCVT